MTNTITVKKNEELILPVFWFGKEEEIAYEILLAEAGASIKFYMFLLGKNTQKVKIDINIKHQEKDTLSKVIIKGVISDSASVDFNGLVKIEKNSTGANAWLAAHLLLLSDNAKGRAVPSLEILENDIKAGHATTVGRVNDLELFYLISRGLSKQKAKKLIVNGFLGGLVKEIPLNLINQNDLRKINYAI